MEIIELENWLRGIKARDPRVLARAITLMESERESDRARVLQLSDALLACEKSSLRIGFSGSPGVGKSTLINALGAAALKEGLSVAVIAVDPSSATSKGSILADKTRMQRLFRDPNVFIRPMPSRCALGGVAPRVYEALQVLEFAGFDIVLIESVGVGQSESDLSDLCDIFVYVTQPESGDNLQAMKRGILEKVQLIVMNKSDLLQPQSRPDKTHLRVSAMRDEGIGTLWDWFMRYKEADSRGIIEKREQQKRRWAHRCLEHLLVEALKKHPVYLQSEAELDRRITAGESSYCAANAGFVNFCRIIR